MVEGMLTSPEGTGIDKKEITLAATGIENLPSESTTAKTDGDGKFTCTIPGNVLLEAIEGASVKFTAHFAGDNEYNASDSNEVSYEPKESTLQLRLLLS